MNIGDRFGRLVVAGIEGTTRAGNIRYCRVKCDCGTEKDVRMSSLKNGKTRSCGCLQLLSVSNALFDRWEKDPRNDRVGQRQGLLTVVRRDYSKNRGNIYWICKCDCGRETSVPSHRLNGEGRSAQSCRHCYRARGNSVQKAATKNPASNRV